MNNQDSITGNSSFCSMSTSYNQRCRACSMKFKSEFDTISGLPTQSILTTLPHHTRTHKFPTKCKIKSEWSQKIRKLSLGIFKNIINKRVTTRDYIIHFTTDPDSAKPDIQLSSPPPKKSTSFQHEKSNLNEKVSAL